MEANNEGSRQYQEKWSTSRKSIYQKINLPKRRTRAFGQFYVWVDFWVSDFVDTNYFSMYSASQADYDCSHTSQKEQE